MLKIFVNNDLKNKIFIFFICKEFFYQFFIFHLQTVLVCLMVFACVFAAPANDETIVGAIEGQDATNPEDPQEILKLLLLKKKLLLFG